MEELNFANRLIQNENRLSKTERQIGQYILENSELVNQMTIQELAHNANVSNASITRFSKRLNYASFAELKSYLGRETSRLNQSQHTLTDEIGDFYGAMIKASQQLIDEKQLSILVDRIKKAKKITLFGIGSSGLTATECKFQFMRMGLTVDCITDPHMMLMEAQLLGTNDLIICISNSGETKALINACNIAKEKNVMISTLTNFKDSSLTRISDNVIFTSSVKSMHDGRFINTQLTMYFILDCIFYELLKVDKYYQNRQKTLALILNEESNKK